MTDLDAAAIAAIGAAVSGAVQLVKMWAMPARFAPLAVLAVAGFFVWLWAWSHGQISRELAFDLITAWIAVSMSAAGAFGLVKAAQSALPRKGEEQS